MKGRCVIASLARIKGGRNVSMEIKRRLRNSILLPTVTWNRVQQSRAHSVQMSLLRGACSVTRWESESIESMYKRCSMEPCANGVKCDVGEWMKRNTLWWFGNIERKNSKKFVKKVYVSETYAAFMNLEKAYDTVDREALWNVLKIYGFGGQVPV